MIKKKVCMIGAFAVGKTSLVQRFAKGVFSEKYHTTVGVRIEKKVVSVDGTDIDLILWDLHGEDDFQKVRVSYLKGAAGCMYVVDGTRAETVDAALDLITRVEDVYPDLASVILLNKLDNEKQWEITEEEIARLTDNGIPVMRVSAKTGHAVDDAFQTLGRLLLRSS